MRTKNLKYIILIFAFIAVITRANAQLEFSFSHDFGSEIVFENELRIWANTPMEDLALAAYNNDTLKMQEIIDTLQVNIDYPDPYYGNSFLYWTVKRCLYSSQVVLLNNGSNPNFHSNVTGISPFILACNQCTNENDIELLKHMLVHGANPNDAPKFNPEYTSHPFYAFKLTPLNAACLGQFYYEENERVYYWKAIQLLLANGADINQHALNSSVTPIISSLIFCNTDMVRTLILMGADTKSCYYNQDDKLYHLKELLEQYIIQNQDYPQTIKDLDEIYQLVL